MGNRICRSCGKALPPYTGSSICEYCGALQSAERTLEPVEQEKKRIEHKIEFRRFLQKTAQKKIVRFGAAALVLLTVLTVWIVSAVKTYYWTDMKSISTDGYTVVGLKKDGTVRRLTWYSSDDCWDEAEDWTDITAVYDFSTRVIGLKTDGTLVTASDSYMWEQKFRTWTDIERLCFTAGHLFGIKTDGTAVMACNKSCGMNCIYCSGYRRIADRNDFYKIDNGVVLFRDGTACPLSKEDAPGMMVERMEKGGFVDICDRIGIYEDGTVGILDDDDLRFQRELAQWTDIVKVVRFTHWSRVYGSHILIGLKKDGTMVTTSNCLQDVSDWTDVVDFDVGVSGEMVDGKEQPFIIGVKSNGKVITEGFTNRDILPSVWNHLRVQLRLYQ